MINAYDLHLAYAVASFSLLLTQYFINSRQKWQSAYRQYLKPSQIILAYILFSYLGGSIFLYLDISYYKAYLTVPQNWTWMIFWLWFCTMLLTLIVTSTSHSWFLLPASGKNQIFLKASILAVLAIFLSQFFIFGMLMWIGTLFYLIVKNIGLTKFLAFIFFSLFALVFIFYGSKRFLIFPLIVALLFMSAIKPPAKLYLFFITILIIFLIVIMSVLRGYGGGTETVLINLYSYLGNDLLWQMIGNNFEFVYFYFHGVNATEMAYNGFGYLFGETFVKGLLFGWNYLGFDHGFRSSIEVYTTIYSPNTRRAGGSYPINIYSEFFMNFSIITLLVFPVFFWWMDYLFRASIRFFGNFKGSYYNLVILVPLVFWARGSSVDLFVYYSFFGLLAAQVVFYILSIKYRL